MLYLQHLYILNWLLRKILAITMNFCIDELRYDKHAWCTWKAIIKWKTQNQSKFSSSSHGWIKKNLNRNLKLLSIQQALSNRPESSYNKFCSTRSEHSLMQTRVIMFHNSSLYDMKENKDRLIYRICEIWKVFTGLIRSFQWPNRVVVLFWIWKYCSLSVAWSNGEDRAAPTATTKSW